MISVCGDGASYLSLTHVPHAHRKVDSTNCALSLAQTTKSWQAFHDSLLDYPKYVVSRTTETNYLQTYAK